MSITTAVSSLFRPHTFTEDDHHALVRDGAQAENVLRKKAQMEELERILKAAEKRGVLKDTFILGGLAHDYLREYRLHGDIDIMFQSYEAFKTIYDLLTESKEYRDVDAWFLRGSSMCYLVPLHDRPIGLLELRWVYQDSKQDTETEGKIWKHKLPGWMQACLGGKTVVIPHVAFSTPEETYTIGEVKVRYLKPEYSYAIKKSSPYVKDQADVRLLSQYISHKLAQEMEHIAKKSGGLLSLPHIFMTLIRSLGGFSDGIGQDAYARLINGVEKQKIS